MRGKRMRARVPRPAAGGGSDAPQRPPRASASTSTLQPRDGSLTDLNVIGCTVDEAIDARRALPRRVAAHRSADRPRDSRVRHGAIEARDRRLLQQHPLVARFATAPPDQGGGGVTVVELKE